MFSVLFVRSAREDRTTRAIIRDEALRLFALEGFEGVSVRQVADAAGVSPALVLYHFGSKDGLRAAVDDHVLRMVETVLSELTARAPDDLYDQDLEGARSLAETMIAVQPGGSPVPAYLRRLLVSDSDASKEMFARLYQIATVTLSSFVASGQATAGEDPPVRAAFLMINDLALLLLRDRLGEVLGFDPLSKEGMARWAKQVSAIYGSGLRDPQPPRRQPSRSRGRSSGASTRSSRPRPHTKGAD
jgi:AcrR family transcriptional regulator